MEEADHKPTKFNMAISTLMRLDQLLKNCAYYSTGGDLLGWNESLLTLRRNIFPFIKDTQIKHIEELFKKVNSKRWLCRNKKQTQVIPGEIDRVWGILDELEIYIQMAMKDAGLLMPKSDDPRFALNS